MAQRGRPVVFKGNEKRHILSVIRKHGLTKGQEVLAGEKISISLPTMGKFASEAGIELSRGRPAGMPPPRRPPSRRRRARHCREPSPGSRRQARVPRAGKRTNRRSVRVPSGPHRP